MALDSTPLGKKHDLICAAGSPLERVLATCDRVAKTDTTVLLTGETGTGKEVIARHLHRVASDGNKNAGAFIPVNCGAIPENLIEAELFGHARGAFTGAHSARKGRVAMAEGGTLFLDEIGELPLSLQVKLLRLLQERTYEPVGESRSVKANFRLIAATNRDLATEVRAGRFRQDLYYRLFVCPMELPPLRARPADIVELLAHFWDRRGETRKFSDVVMQRLTTYPWPGNVRELENLVERLSVCAVGAVIEEADLPSLYSLSSNAIEMSGPIPPAPGPAAVFAQAFAPPMPASPMPTSPMTASPMPASPMPAAPAASSAPAVPPLPSTATEGWATQDVPLPWLQGSAEGEPVEEVTAAAAAPAHVPTPAHPGPALPQVVKGDPIDLPALLRSLEWAYIETALEQTGGNKQTAARLLGLRRTTLVEKLRRRQKAEEVEAAATA